MEEEESEIVNQGRWLMKTDKITVFDLFERQRRYLVPIFQRGYVWTKEGQWEPLWEDIADQAKLVQLHKGSSRNTIRKHFLGAIVLSQVPTVIRQMPASEIVDGQQRLLTLQVFLAAPRDAVVDLGDDYLKMQLGRLTSNPAPFYHEDEQFKVWPTNAYHDDLRTAMSAGTPDALSAKYPQRRRYGKLTPPRPALVDAYLYFHERIMSFLNSEDEDRETPADQQVTQEALKERSNLLFEAVMRYVQLVEIQLDVEDDPQVIFETLNYRGVPLEPSDLIRNFIFLYAARQNKDVNALYNQWWKDYDEVSGTTKFWKEKERQGRFFRSRLDLFFFHYLTYRIGREIKMGHIYQEFKDWWGDSGERSVETELEAAQRSSMVFRSLLDSDDSQRLGVLAQRLRILDTTTVYPFILWLCEHQDKIAQTEFDGILADIESYIVRRAICGLTPKNYNRIFLALLTKLSKEGLPDRASLRRELLSLEGDSAIWPNNDTFFRSLIGEPLYNSIGPRRVRLVLTALELANRTPKQESIPLPIGNSLTIEHIMPRGFKPEEWPYPEHEIVELKKLESNQEELESKRRELELRRWALLHSLGNLTLLTQPLNSEVSNGPFNLKRPEITKQSLLVLNSYFQRFSDDAVWNEKEIVERGFHLAAQAVEVWQYPKI